MIKAVSSSLIVAAALIGVLRPVSAQPTPSEAAAEEALHRQVDTIQLRRTLAEAKVLREKGDLVNAAKKYEDAANLMNRVGTNIDAEREETVSGFVATRLGLAKAAAGTKDFQEADVQVSRALRIDPKNQQALAFKAANDKLILENLGRSPSKEELAKIPEFKAERVKTSVLVQDGRLLMEMGKLDEAEAKLKQAAKDDPESRAAYYYLNLIKESRFSQETRKHESSAKDLLIDVEKSWNQPVQRELLPASNPYARTNRIYTSRGRQQISSKIENIVLEEWAVPSEVRLDEVIKELSSEIRKRDPDKRGLNFIISSQIDRPQANAFGGIDPLTQQPIPAANDAPVEVEAFLVRMDPPLRNVRVADVLDAIIKVAKAPQGVTAPGIKYSIEDYAIVFTQRTAEAQELFVRNFRVDPNTFKQGLEGMGFSANPFQGLVTSQGGQGGGGGGGGGGAGGGQGGQNGQSGGAGGYFAFGGSSQGGQGGGGGGGGGAGGQSAGGIAYVVSLTNASLSTIQQEVRLFFQAAGVDFPAVNTNQAAGGFGQGAGQGGGQFGGQPGQPPVQNKALFFNDRTGALFVRATLRDLDIIEGAIHALNITPSQVTIEAKFAEISQTDSKGVGFDWFLGNILGGGGKVALGGGSSESLTSAASKANPTALPFPYSGGLPSIAPNALTDQNLTAGLRQNNTQIAPVATISGILTDPQFRVVIRAMETRDGVDLISSPKITTVSGRQARISVEETKTIIVGTSVQALGGGAATAAGTTGARGN